MRRGPCTFPVRSILRSPLLVEDEDDPRDCSIVMNRFDGMEPRPAAERNLAYMNGRRDDQREQKNGYGR